MEGWCAMAPESAGGSSMLKSLRGVVQEVSTARDLPETLAIIVRRVREEMETQVCSVYLVDPASGRYVFMATEGLNKALEGRFSLARDEGLVGYVARREEPLNLEDAAAHPKFKFIEGSGEELFRSFLGVPIIHHREVLGVLVVQQRERRRFDEDEEAFLVTMSAQLAAIIAHAGLAGSYNELRRGTRPKSGEFLGISGAAGIGIGQVVIVSPPSDLKAVPQRACEDSEREIALFHSAVSRVQEEIAATRAELTGRVGAEELALFDVHAMLLADRALSGEVVQRIREGNWAQGALSQVVLEHVRTFELMEDAYIRERGADIRDLGRRVLAQLHDKKRKITIPGFYDAVVPLSKQERANWAALKYNAKASLKKIGLPPAADIGEAGFTPLEREWGRPTAEINGIVGGYTGVGAKTVIPAKASAKVSFRLVANQDPVKITKAFFKWCKDRTPPGCHWEFIDHHGGLGVTCPIDSEELQAASRAIKRATKKAPALIKSGGSIPVAGMLKDLLKIDTIFMGFGLDDDRVHSPNEKFELDCFRMGARSHALLIDELSK
jgi:putative methionine-R-sulfoxide reductase with GAF domain